jgi:hypothetical protein
MGCCGSGSSKPRKNNIGNNPSGNTGKNVFIWGVVIVVIVGLLVWLV